MHKIEELSLNKSYDFDVVISVESSNFSGTLKLTPNEIQLSVFGEETEDRKWPFPIDNLSDLKCRTTHQQFTLLNLTITDYKGLLLSKHPSQITSFQINYLVESVIMQPENTSSRTNYHGISIHSQTINSWLGCTEEQQRILKSEHAGIRFYSCPVEFSRPLENQDLLSVSYNLKKFYSLPEFKSGLTFPPSLNYHSREPLSPPQAIILYRKMNNLFSFITNKAISVQQLRLHGSRKDSFIYTTSPKPKTDSRILYPYSSSTWAGPNDLPPFRLLSFNKFFSLPNKEQEYFEKYLKYSRMNNTEDIFLGYFRILESMCYLEKPHIKEESLYTLCSEIKRILAEKNTPTKDINTFIRGVKRLNRSKYNTEKCIQELFNSLSSETKNLWKFGKERIGQICKLRNDITHANEHYVNEKDFNENLIFLESLLVISLLKIIDTPIENIHKIVSRIDNYYFISKQHN